MALSNKIKIIFTSDVHGKIFPHSYSDGKPVKYGFMRAAEYIESLRDENTILIDNGDTITGSPIQTYHYSVKPQDVSPVTETMKMIGYDYINVGNHDFDYGVEKLMSHIEGTGATCINLNLGYDYAIKEIAGKKIAIFGVVTHFTPRWEKEENVEGAVFPDAFTLVKEMVDRIKADENPDYIVCCYHGGFERTPGEGAHDEINSSESQGARMLEEIDGLDVLIMGHQHTLSAGKYNGCVYAQPGVDGSHIGIIEIDCNGDGNITSEVIPVPDIDNRSENRLYFKIKDSIMDEEAECQKWLDMPLGKSIVDLEVRDEKFDRLNKSQFITFINKVQMECLNGDISSASLLQGSTGLKSVITMRDIISSYYFSNSLVKKRINGRVLREYLEKNLWFWQVRDGKIQVSEDYRVPIFQHFNYDMLDGIEYEAEISRPRGERLTSLTRNGKEISDEDEFTIVLNNYRASGGGGFPMLAELEVLDEDTRDMVDIISEYIRKHSPIDFLPVHNIKIKA